MKKSSDLLIQALQLHQSGRIREAIDLYHQILARQPNHAGVLCLSGTANFQIGQQRLGLEQLQRSIALEPSHLAYGNLGTAFNELKQPDKALACFDQALALKPDYAEAYDKRGNALHDLGRLDEALASYDKALALNPGFAEACNDRGNVLQALKRLDEALASYDQALALHPAYVQAHYNRSIVLHDLGRLDEALASYDRTLALKPDYAEAYNNRGNVLKAAKRMDEALASYGKALALKPDYAEALSNRGNVFKELNRLDEALSCYSRALAINPRFVEVYRNLGILYQEQARLDEAIDCFHRALELQPDFAEVRWHLAMTRLQLIAESDIALEAGSDALLRELDGLESWFAPRMEFGSEAVGACQPFYLAYQELNHRELLSRYGSLCARLMQHWFEQQQLPAPVTHAHTPLRIGLVSAHMRNHSVWNAIVKGWLQQLDRNRFELYLFHIGTQRDAETVWASSHAHSFEGDERSLRQWVDAIMAKQVDVLIYPEIGMDPLAVKLASLRLAPVQMASWGHPETTGLPTMDYYLSAEDLEPPEAQDGYTEQLVRLPHLGVCYHPPTVSPHEPDLQALGTDPVRPILLCPGVPFKYVPSHDRVLIEIVRRIGDAQLVFFTHPVNALSNKLQQRLQHVFTHEGLDYGRHVVFIPWQPLEAFYGLMRCADVFLDTIGFSGFNTAMQAIECDLPIVTKAGRFMRGRLASGILHRMGMEELVTDSEATYVDLAVRLVRDDAYRQVIRSRMQALRSTLLDDAAPVRALEEFLLAAVGNQLVANPKHTSLPSNRENVK